MFEPKIWNEYLRLTLVAKTRPERVTVDLNVGFVWRRAHVEFPGIAVVEIKQDDPTLPSTIALEKSTNPFTFAAL